MSNPFSNLSGLEKDTLPKSPLSAELQEQLRTSFADLENFSGALDLATSLRGPIPEELANKLRSSFSDGSKFAGALKETMSPAPQRPGELQGHLKSSISDLAQLSGSPGASEMSTSPVPPLPEELSDKSKIAGAQPSQNVSQTISRKCVVDMTDRIWISIGELQQEFEQLRHESTKSAVASSDVSRDILTLTDEVSELHKQIAALVKDQEALRSAAASSGAAEWKDEVGKLYEQIATLVEDQEALRSEAARSGAADWQDEISNLCEQLAALKHGQDAQQVRLDDLNVALEAAVGRQHDTATSEATTSEMKQMLKEGLERGLEELRREVQEAFKEQEATASKVLAEETAKMMDNISEDIHERISQQTEDMLSNREPDLQNELQEKLKEFELVRQAWREDSVAIKDIEKRLLKWEDEIPQLPDTLQMQSLLEDVERNMEDKMQSGVLEVERKMEDRLQKCTEQIRAGLVDNLNAQVHSVVEKLSQCEAEMPKIDKALEGVKQGEIRIQDVLDKQKEFDNKVTNLDGQIKNDLIAHKEKINEVMGSLNQRQGECDLRIGETGNELDDLREKTIRQLMDLTAVADEALPTIVQRAEKLAGSVQSLESDVANMSSRFQQDIEKLKNSLSSGLREERSRARGELTAVERWQAEAEPRFEGIDRMLTNMDRRELALDQRCASCEEKDYLQDQRLTSHDEAVRTLAGRCQDMQRLLENRINEVREAAQEDLYATTVAAMKGEIALMASVSQLSNQRHQFAHPTLPSMGHAWPAQGAAVVPGVGQVLLPPVPNSK